MLKNIFLYKFKDLLLILIPISLASGSFIPDLLSSLAGIIFLIILDKKEYKFYFVNKYSIIFFIWCLYILILSLLSDNIILSLESSLFYSRFGIFALAIWHSSINNKNFNKFFLYSITLTICFVVFDSLFQFYVGTNILGFTYDSNLNSRLSGIFGNELILGSFLVRLLPIFLGMIFLSNLINNKYLQLLIILVLVSCDFAIYLSGERTAFFMLLLMTVMFLLLLTNIKRLRIIALTITITVIVIQSLFNSTLKERMFDKTITQMNIFNGKINIFSIQHQNLYETSIKIIKDNLIIGIGPKMFREICKEKKYETLTNQDVSINGCNTSPHNIYIQILTETGLIGLFLLLFYYCVLTKRLFVHFYSLIINNKSRLIKNSNICFMIALFVYFFPFMPNGNFFHNWISIIYYIPIGFLLANNKS